MRLRGLFQPAPVRAVTAGVVLALGLSAAACTPASASGAVNGRFFGMHAPGLQTAAPSAKVGAFNLTTNGVYWPRIETSPGHFDFTRLDAVVAAAQARHARPMLVLGQTPQFHSTRPNATPVAATVPRMAAWKSYVTAVVERYGTKLDYEIWPEPDIITNWSGTKKQLAQLVAAASKIIHKKAGHAVVVGPALVLRMKYQQKFMNAFYGIKVGGKAIGSYVDAVGIDPYPTIKGTPEDSLALIQKAKTILRKHKVKKPLWNVEINYGVAGGGSTTTKHLSNHVQAAYVTRTFMLNAGAGVKRVYWLGWYRFTTMAIQMVRADETTPTPAGKAYSVVRSWLLKQHAHACTRSKKTHVWSCKLVRKGHASYVYWTTKGKTHVRAPKGSRHVETMTGAVSRTHAGKKVTVTTAPVRVYH